jgi:hypothetical protein
MQEGIMHLRKIKKYTAGQWKVIKWSDIEKGDLLRIYDRGMKVCDDSGEIDFRATSNSYPVEIDGKTYWQFNYEPYDRSMENKSTKDIQQGQ